jgi:glycerophosphoryl diester phosphodiesterase
MKVLLHISLFLILIGCTKESYEITNLNGNKITRLGHAGMGISSTYPINSFESIAKAIEKGAEGTEIDVQLTKDNVLVAFHDEELENSTNLYGRIRELNWEEISEGYYDVTPLTRYRIIKLEDLLDFYTTENIVFTFDVKLYPDEEEDYFSYIGEFASRISDLFSEKDLYQNCFVESQSTDFIASLQALDPAIKQYIYPQSFDEGFEVAQNLNLFGITISTHEISEVQVELAHEQGFWITIWDVHSKSENREAIHKNPDMIQTDLVKYLTKQLQ